MMLYNYVIFNNIDDRLSINRDGYFNICIRDLENIEGIKVVYNPYDWAPIPIRLLFNFHNSGIVNKYIKLPLKSIWYPYYFKNKFKNDKPICFVVLNKYIPLEYFKYLKNVYPSSKIVLFHRDLLKVGLRINEKLIKSDIVDLQITIDKNEAETYSMVHYDEFESKIDVPISTNYPLYDVFFAGKAKDRMTKLIEAYDIFSSSGLKCFFYITGAKGNARIHRPGIVYSDSPMSYTKMLFYSVNSKCMLEFNQENALGYTSRFLEAVMYGKKLITDNIHVKDSPFYNPNFIDVIKYPSDITTTFVDDKIVDYRYKDEFSPKHLILFIDGILAGNV